MTVFLLALSILLGTTATTAFAESGTYQSDPEKYYYSGISMFSDEREYLIFENNKAFNSAIEGAAYDIDTNTLSLTDFKHSELSLLALCMGDDFKLKITGDCALLKIKIFGENYGGGLEICGDGFLEVGYNKEITPPIAIDLNGYNCESALSFGKDVKVNLYSTVNAASISYSNHSDFDTAITFGNGKNYDYTGGKNIENEPVLFNAIKIDEFPWWMDCGYRVNRKSDPDGIYAAEKIDDNYWISRYYYLEEYDSVIYDDYTFDQICLSEEEFNNSEYSLVIENQPKTVYYTTDYNEEYNRGERIRKAISKSNPGEVFGVNFAWIDDSDDPTYYYVHHLVWNNELKIYEEDDSFSAESLTAEEFAKSDYEILKDDDGEYIYIRYLNEFTDFEDYAYRGTLTKKTSAPNEVYARTEYDDGDYGVCKLVYNEDRGYYFAEDEEIMTSEEFENAGYYIEKEDRPVEYVAEGIVELEAMQLHTDENGKEYLVSFRSNTAFEFDRNNHTEILGETFYFPKENEEIDISALIPQTKEVELNSYHYEIPDREFIYNEDETESVLAGDVNSDGKVNGLDSSILARYIASWDNYQSRIKNMNAADINGDRKVNGLDSSILARHIAGWTQYDKYFIT